jgi:hypothetical protein
MVADSRMKKDISVRQMSRGEKETETEATRLIELIEEALAAVAIRSRTDTDSLEAVADRIERAARDLSVALRELAHERRAAPDETE